MSTPDLSAAEREWKVAQAHADMLRSVAALRKALAALEQSIRYDVASDALEVTGQLVALSRGAELVASGWNSIPAAQEVGR